MLLEGTIVNGKVELDDASVLHEGTRVRVEVADAKVESGSSLTTLLKYAGLVKELPADMARNHDHYLHEAIPSPIM